MSKISKNSVHRPAASEMHTAGLAAAITKAASKQTYYTVRFLVDRPRVPDAYRSYAYFRWVDDRLDSETAAASERVAFLNRQQALLDACYRREIPEDICSEEQLLVDLVRNDTEKDSGLQSYLRNMMAVMDFDVKRCGRIISQIELAEYTRLLATAVTDALHFFIGHTCPAPCNEMRYQAVQGAHVIHMLRDAWEDVAVGYFNISSEYLQAQGISPQDIDSQAYRKWVANRVGLAKAYFKAGEQYIAQVKNLRCRLAGFAYTARFQWMLHVIEKEGYRLRESYPERKSLQAGLWMIWKTITSALAWRRANSITQAVQPAQYHR